MMTARKLLFLALLWMIAGCREEHRMSAPDAAEKALVSRAELEKALQDAPSSASAPPPDEESAYSGPVLGPLRAGAPTNETLLAGAFPGYKLEREGAYGNYHLSKKGKLVATLTVDQENRLQAAALYRAGITVGGTSVQIGASFDKVARAFSLTECEIEAGEDTTIECRDDYFTFSFKATKEAVSYLKEKAPDAPSLALSLEEAKKLIGKQRLSGASWSRERGQ